MFKSGRLALVLVALCTISLLQVIQVKSCSKAYAKRRVESYFRAFPDLKVEVCGQNDPNSDTNTDTESGSGLTEAETGALLTQLRGLTILLTAEQPTSIDKATKTYAALVKLSLGWMLNSKKINPDTRAKLTSIKSKFTSNPTDDAPAAVILKDCKAEAEKV